MTSIALNADDLLTLLNLTPPVHLWPMIPPGFSRARVESVLPAGAAKEASSTEMRAKLQAAWLVLLAAQPGATVAVEFEPAELWLLDEVLFQVNYKARYAEGQSPMGLVRKVWEAIHGTAARVTPGQSPATSEEQRQRLAEIDQHYFGGRA